MPASGFAEFVDDSLPALSRYAYALTGNVHAGEDLLQDTLVKLAGAWRRVRHDGNPLGYARAVMFRTYVSRWRVTRRRPVLQEYRDEPAAGDQYANVEARDALRRALAGIPRLQRAVLVLGYLDDMTDDEIATLLDRRPATIRSLRHRGLQTLRARLASRDKAEVTRGAN
ncbi:MAG TPA: SigE family RNA polymerase sigma factor [Pilimelia sp.]|nr:SigE family RNA polymerase sigma factor [Pilimelia sp.]